MNILKRTYAKILDKITIEEAPIIFNGIVGFNNDADLCIEAGYKEVQFATETGNLAIYEETDTEIIQSYITIDISVYSSRVSELIRVKYSVDDELAIHRKRLSDPSEFQDYFNFCEKCKKEAKLEQIAVIR